MAAASLVENCSRSHSSSAARSPLVHVTPPPLLTFSGDYRVSTSAPLNSDQCSGQTTTLPEQLVLPDLRHDLVDNVDARLAKTQQGQPPPHLVVAAQQQPAVRTPRGVRPARATPTRRHVQADAVCVGGVPRHPVGHRAVSTCFAARSAACLS